MLLGLWLPTCIFLSPVAHVVLLTAVAVPRQRATAHGETMTVDLVRPDEIPESLQHEPPPEAAPRPSAPASNPAPQSQQAVNVLPREPAAKSSTRPEKPQSPPQQQATPQQPQQQQRSQRAPQVQQPPPPQQQVETPLQEQPAPDVRVAQENPAEQAARLSAMLNLPGPSTGDGTGAEAFNKAALTGDEIAALRSHLKSCWKLPAGVAANQRLKVVMRMSLRHNGTLSAEPALIEAAMSPLGPPLVKEAMRAIKQCEPYTMLPAEKYREWRVLDIDFSPDQMSRG